MFHGGRVAYAARGNLEQFDFDAHAAASQGNAGRYVRNGNNLRIEWANGSVQDGDLRPDGSGGFQFYGAPFAPIQRVLPDQAQVGFMHQRRGAPVAASQ